MSADLSAAMVVAREGSSGVRWGFQDSCWLREHGR